MRVDGQKPDMRRERRTSGRLTAKSTSIKDAERRSGDCGRKAVELTPGELSCVTSVTEGVERHWHSENRKVEKQIGRAGNEDRRPEREER